MLGTPATWNPKGGAPKGNRNAFKHGHNSGAAKRFHAAVRLNIAYAQALIRIVHATPKGAVPDITHLEPLRALVDDLNVREGLEPRR